jgi:hypothetical protein
MDMDPVMTMREELDDLDDYLASRDLTPAAALSILATTLLAYANAYSVPMADITSRLLTAEKLRAIVQGTKH